MKSYEVGISFLVFADDEQHAAEQFVELLHDNGDHPNFIFESDAEFNHWSDHELLDDWRLEVRDDNTRLGFWDWLATVEEADAEIERIEGPQGHG